MGSAYHMNDEPLQIVLILDPDPTANNIQKLT